MQALFERKGVHLRPDFEKWVPIDIDMTKEKRDAIFAKAGGQRETPVLFIDDEHIGGYDHVLDLEENGELDDLLAY